MQREMELFSENLSFSSQQPLEEPYQPPQPFHTDHWQQNSDQSQTNYDHSKVIYEQDRNHTIRTNPSILRDNFTSHLHLHHIQHKLKEDRRQKTQISSLQEVYDQIKLKNFHHHEIYDKALVQPKMPTTNIQENNHRGNISLDAYRKPKLQQKNKTAIELNENAESLYYIEIQQQKGKEESNNSDGQRRAQQLLEQQKGFDIQRMKSVINSQYCPFYLRRDKQCGLNYCNPDFYLQSLHKKMVMSSRKSSLTINSQYKIYLCEGDYELMRDGSLLLGKVEGNFFGTEFNIYKLNKSKGMQLQATVAYKAQCNCQSTKVMQVYIKNPSKYDTQVEEQIVRESGRIKSLKDLYFNRNTPDGYVHRLVTKQPKWREDLQCYTQNFKGKSKMSSTKNIILIDEAKPKQNSLLFCKISQERFYCEMGGPLSVLLGMGIIVSMFDFKLLCQ